MNFRQQVTSALAWAGLVIVIAVPCAEVISSKLLSATTPAAATAAVPQAKVVVAKPQPTPVAKVVAVAPLTASGQVKVAPAPVTQPKPVIAMPPVVQAKIETNPAPTVVAEQPAAPATPASQPTPTATPTGDENVVQDYLATNKKLPSYISASPKPAVDPAPMTPAAQQLASTLSSTGGDVAPAAAAPSGSSIAIPAGTAGPPAPSDAGVASIDSTASAPAPVPMPVSSRPKGQPEQTVTEADLKDWKSGTLEDYLKSRGLLSAPSTDQGNSN